MKKISIIILFISLLSCTSKKKSGEGDTQKFQAISVLGDTLYSPELDEEVEKEFKTNLAEAESEYENRSNEVDALIWYGRRTAYLGNYRKAIGIYSEGLEKHPDNPRILRHRGHRYLSIREFDKARNDLELAAELIKGTEDRVEQDGLPNEKNIPLSTLHTNIWYHLGLVYYLKGDYEKAENAYRGCLAASSNDDMDVSSKYWLYMTLKRLDKDSEAQDVLNTIEKEMNIIANDSYHTLLLVFKGEKDGDNLLNDSMNSLNIATLGYGLGNWHYMNERYNEAKSVFERVYNSKQWAAFGYIAAETDLDRINWE